MSPNNLTHSTLVTRRGIEDHKLYRRASMRYSVYPLMSDPGYMIFDNTSNHQVYQDQDKQETDQEYARLVNAELNRLRLATQKS